MSWEPKYLMSAGFAGDRATRGVEVSTVACDAGIGGPL